MIQIETERLVLRNVLPGDEAVIFDYRNNELCSKYQRGQVTDYEGICSLVDKHKEDYLTTDEPFMVAMTLRNSGHMIGEAMVMPGGGTFSIGYTVHYDYHRKGYAFEVLTAIINLLHQNSPDWDFISFTEPENKASIALLTKLGYKNMGYLPKRNSYVFGKWTLPETEAEIASAVAK